jgi:hypothetical protein
MGSQQASDTRPMPTITCILKLGLDPAEQVVGQNGDENMAFDPLGDLMEVWSKAQIGLQHFKSGFCLQKRHL